MATEGPAVWDQGLQVTGSAPVEWSFGCAYAHFILPSFPRLLPSLSHSNAGQCPVLLLILGWCTVPRGRCRGSVPSHRGTLIVCVIRVS